MEILQADKRTDAPEMSEIQAKAAKKDGLSLKGSYSSLLSTLAFFISAFGFYLNNLKWDDDLRVIIDRTPSFPLEGDRSTSSDPYRLVFVNAGNQSAALLSIRVFVGRYRADGRTCDFIEQKFDMDMSPFVIKPGEVVVKDIEKKSASTPEPKSGARLPEFPVEMCTRLFFSTPSVGRTYKDIQFVFHFDKLISETSALAFAKPIILRHESGNAMGAWWRQHFGPTTPP
jgi:hypothetical protein